MSCTYLDLTLRWRMAFHFIENDMQTIGCVEKLCASRGRKWVKLPLSHQYQYAYQSCFFAIRNVPTKEICIDGFETNEKKIACFFVAADWAKGVQIMCRKHYHNAHIIPWSNRIRMRRITNYIEFYASKKKEKNQEFYTTKEKKIASKLVILFRLCSVLIRLCMLLFPLK